MITVLCIDISLLALSMDPLGGFPATNVSESKLRSIIAFLSFYILHPFALNIKGVVFSPKLHVGRLCTF